MGVPERISSTMWESHLGHFPSLGMSITKCKLRRHQLDDQIICGGPFNTSPRREIPICHPPLTHMVMLPPPKRESCVLEGFQQHSVVQKYPSQTAGQNQGNPEFETHNNWGHPDCWTHTSAVMTRTFQVTTSLLRQISGGASVFKIPTATNYMAKWIRAESEDSSVVLMRIIGWRSEWGSKWLYVNH